MFLFSGIIIPWGPILTFNQCLEMGIVNVADEVVRVSEGAAKEYAIEQTLDKMEREWEDNLMELTPHKKTGNVNNFSLKFYFLDIF